MIWIPAPLPQLATDRFAMILNNLLAFISGKHRPGVDMVLLALAHGRVVRIRNRFAALVARYRAGTLRPPRPGQAERGQAERGQAERGRAEGRRADRPPRPPDPLPRSAAWLCPMVPAWAASCGNHLQLLLDEPEMRDILAAAPQAKRVLRPLFRMLGHQMPDILALPARARQAPVASAPAADPSASPGPRTEAPGWPSPATLSARGGGRPERRRNVSADGTGVVTRD